jgi:peptidoglycan/LPS O-acetylase OafA/YrhL
MDKQIGSLTSLRGLAAVIVVVHHFSYYTLPPVGAVLSSYSSFFKNGYLCVDLFFILSGFIMTHVYLERFYLGVNKSNYRSYLRARFARIYPLHLFTLSALILLETIKLFLPNTIAFVGKFNLISLLANVFLLQAFDLHCPPLFWCDTYWNEPAWSISVEFLIYCIFPFILFSLLKTKPKTDAIVYIITLIALLLLIKFTRGNLDTIIGIPSIARCGLECAIGIITYKVYRCIPAFSPIPNSARSAPNPPPATTKRGAIVRVKYHSIDDRQSLKFNLLAIFAVIWVTLIMHNWVDNLRGVHDWLILPAFSLLILAVANKNNGAISKLLNSPLLLYLGTISYSIYMVHWCLAELLKTFWLYKFNLVFGSGMNEHQSLLALGLFIPIVLLTASLTYRFIEVPCRNMIGNRSQLST